MLLLVPRPRTNGRSIALVGVGGATLCLRLIVRPLQSALIEELNQARRQLRKEQIAHGECQMKLYVERAANRKLEACVQAARAAVTADAPLSLRPPPPLLPPLQLLVSRSAGSLGGIAAEVLRRVCLHVCLSPQAMPAYQALRTIEDVRKTKAGIQHEAAALHMKSGVGRVMLHRLQKIRKSPEAAGRLKTGLVMGLI